MRYRQRIDGDGFTVPNGQVTRWACCDCGLVHDLAFVAVDGEIGVAARRNRRATAARRRSLNANPQQTTGAKPGRQSSVGEPQPKDTK